MKVNEKSNNETKEIPNIETPSKDSQNFSEKFKDGWEKTGNKVREIGSNVKSTLSKDFQIVSKKVVEGWEKTGDKVREIGHNVKSKIDERRFGTNSAKEPSATSEPSKPSELSEPEL